LLLVAVAAGFLVSFAGVKKPEAAGLEASLGKQNSKIEIYIFSDWLCPVCIKIEPVLEAVLPQLEKRAKLHFIDKPVHKESMNFVPYHLSFLVNEKAKYPQLRKALFNLAATNRNPSLADVQTAINPLGVTYKQLSFMDVSQMMAQAQALSTEYKVTGTPTIVVLNSSSKKSKTLVGGKEITADNLLKAVKSLE
jgi:protein-disulfide isomerase